MKPYTLLRDSEGSDSITFGLYERDGVKYYQVNTQPVASSKESNCEKELARMMARPFRPANQPRVLIVGLGMGCALNAFAEELPQQKASFEVLDLNKEGLNWFNEYLIEDPETLMRTTFSVEAVQSFIRSKSDVYHAIFFDPELWRACGSKEDLTSKPYLNSFVNALKMGGLLGVITERSDKIIEGRMERAGLEVSVERLPAVSGGKRQRTIWLAKKGHYRKKEA